MDIEQLRTYCLQMKGTDEAFPFDETTLVFRVMGKIFAAISLNNPWRVTLKCNADYAIELRDQYESIAGAWHWNKKYWNQIDFNGDVDDNLILHLVDHSYNEVIKNFNRKLRLAYGRI